MTTPTGTISLNDVNVELGLSGTTTIQMNQANVRTLAGVGGSGTIISMNDLRGKSNRVTINYIFSANTADANINISALGTYIAGKSDVTITINSGVYLYATTTSGYGLNLSGATTGDTVTIVNNGYIMGMGGTGGGNTTLNNSSPTNCDAFPGGPALNLNIGVNPTINNTNGSAYIGGGGGGGGGDYSVSYTSGLWRGGGGGAGGGAGGGYGSGISAVYNAGGAGGAIGSSGANGPGQSGGGGGRIFPSSSLTTTSSASGTQSVVGTGNSGGGTGFTFSGAATGNVASSTGGGTNQNGGCSTTNAPTAFGPLACGGGGGWGASGATRVSASTFSGAGAAGGKAVNLNGRSITWVSGDTSRVYGAIS